jgi:hypothetical protein
MLCSLINSALLCALFTKKTQMKRSLYYLLLPLGLSLAVLGCKPATSAAVEAEPTVTIDQLQAAVEAHLQSELAALNNPALQGMTVVDTMFSKEFYERESIIYKRALEGKEDNMRRATHRFNEAQAVLAENPEDATAQVEYQRAQETIAMINAAQVKVDSFANATKALGDANPVHYYEVVLTYVGKSADGTDAPVNFGARVDKNLKVIQAGQTRRSAKGGK